MASRRTAPEQTSTLPTLAASDALSTLTPPTRTEDEESSFHLPSASRQSVIAGTNRRSNHPDSIQNPPAPSTLPIPRKRHRNHRRNNPSSQTSVVDAGNPSEDRNRRKRTQKNVDNDRPARRAKNGASSYGGLANRAQSSGNTGFKRRQTSTNAAAERSGPGSSSSRFSGHGGSQVDVNANQQMEFSNLAGTGGTGGAGGFGGLIGGTGGNGQGTVFNMNLVFNFPR
ncbi:hypothetical protein MSAN_01831000 [Mycena sanguinolenta]|uniref:Uncharacterized protein n=1 Tax=Mycena sanguinolenta TaxID=230812 RepID=A0A8H6XQB9_9AGAR|nr:hypothetical protein MSAN_01831000 [Mycena sanguinolenta]